jgi:putative addiction module component (TIGR02574 family)
MAVGTNHVFEDALALPTDERLVLVERLLESLNPAPSDEIARLWAEEAEQRIDQIDRGEARTIPADVVFQKVQAKLAR